MSRPKHREGAGAAPTAAGPEDTKAACSVSDPNLNQTAPPEENQAEASQTEELKDGETVASYMSEDDLPCHLPPDLPPHPYVYLEPWEQDVWNAAGDYAARDWPVFPARISADGSKKSHKSGKRSNGRRWGSTTSLSKIDEDWAEWPDAMVGIVTGSKENEGADILVLDIDTSEGHRDDGVQNLESLLASIGKTLDDLPRTPVASTPTGGRHFYLAYRKDRGALKFKRHLVPGVDIQADKRTVMAPPSYRRDKGDFYRWIISPAEQELAPIPDWLLELLLEPQCAKRKQKPRSGSAPTSRKGNESRRREDAEEARGWALEDLRQAIEGSRNTTLNKSAYVLGRYIGGGYLDEAEIRAELTEAALAIGLEEDEIEATIESGVTAGKAKPIEVDEAGGSAVSIRNIDLSHDTLARQLGQQCFDLDARYVSKSKKWLFWAGGRWERDDRLSAMTRTRKYLRAFSTQLIQAADQEAAGLEPRKAAELQSWARREARKLRDKDTISAIELLARSNLASAASPDWFDHGPMLLGTPKGTVDLRTGLLREARREDMISKLTACGPAEPGTEPTLLLKVLRRIFRENEEVIRFLQRLLGYALTGLTVEHKLVFFYGTGRNGKGVIMNTASHIWGDYARNASTDLFLTSNFSQHPTGLAGLHGARLVLGSEIPKGVNWNEARLKDLTGGDRLTARYMRGDYFDFHPQFTLIIAGNEKPSLAGVDPAIRARMVLVPFDVQIPPEEQDPNLKDKLLAEAPAILRWAIDGAVEWHQRGLDVPGSILDASDAYLDDEDLWKGFIADEVIIDPGAVTEAAALHERFEKWCKREGAQLVSRIRFNKEMRARGWVINRVSGGRVFPGLRLRDI
jgi:putative DNA primase/helicase